MTPIDSQKMCPWPESVTFTSFPSGATLQIDNAGVYPQPQAEAEASNGIYLTKDVKVKVSTPSLGSFGLKVRDSVTYNGDVYVIRSIVKSVWLMFTEVTARCLSLTYGLLDVCDVRRPTNSPGANLLRVPSFSAVYANVPCRLQPLRHDQDTDAGRESTRQQFLCYLGIPADVRIGDTITVNEAIYEVTEQSRIDQYDMLTSVACERVD